MEVTTGKLALEQTRISEVPVQNFRANQSDCWGLLPFRFVVSRVAFKCLIENIAHWSFTRTFVNNRLLHLTLPSPAKHTTQLSHHQT